MAKTLTIKHDGKLVISGYGTFVLGDTSVNGLLATALGLNETDYKEYEADVELTIQFKNSTPDVRWSDIC